jgi:hypothetical protein
MHDLTAFSIQFHCQNALMHSFSLWCTSQGDSTAVTSSEFDQFLSQRVQEMQHVPNVTPQGQGSNMTSGSQGQQSGGLSGTELFSL